MSNIDAPKEPDPIFFPSLYLPPTRRSSLWDVVSAIDCQENRKFYNSEGDGKREIRLKGKSGDEGINKGLYSGKTGGSKSSLSVHVMM